MGYERVNEVQVITLALATGGTYTLTLSGQTTAAIAYNAAASAVKTAIEALSNVGSGNTTVTGVAGGPYVVTFLGALANTNLAQMTTTSSLTGTGATVTVATAQQGTANLPRSVASNGRDDHLSIVEEVGEAPSTGGLWGGLRLVSTGTITPPTPPAGAEERTRKIFRSHVFSKRITGWQ
jgi:hypothetical protein